VKQIELTIIINLQDSTINAIPLAFLDAFFSTGGAPEINLANVIIFSSSDNNLVRLCHNFNRFAVLATGYSLALILRTVSSSQVTSEHVKQRARLLLSVSEVPVEPRLSALMLKE
jgi:hypothetical protein